MTNKTNANFQQTVAIIEALENNGGITLKDSAPISYKRGYQVATEGVEVKTIQDVISAIRKYAGNCGIWLSEGIYYVDKSHHIMNREAAVEMGKTHDQQSIFDWAKQGLIWLKEA